MRIAWNIIENSTIDSSDTYHAALRLIEKLSAKSHTIYNALANEFESFELGNQYHAQEQVAEEIAKAKQILNGGQRTDGKTWEEIIIETERYAFFKGAIRFLFQNAEGKVTKDSWELFDNKWANAKKYFNGDGVCQKYVEGCVLLRTLISYFSKWKNFTAPFYVNSKENWRDYILLNKDLNAQVNRLLSNNIMCDFENFESDIDDARMRKTQDQLVKTNILDNLDKDWYYLEKDYVRLHVYRKNHGNDIYLGDSMHENRILASLIEEKRIKCNQRIKNTNFFRGENINFLYDNNHQIQWFANPNEKELDVYLMENDWVHYKKRPNYEKGKPDKDNHYCFRVTEDMESNPSKFTEALDKLINP